MFDSTQILFGETFTPQPHDICIQLIITLNSGPGASKHNKLWPFELQLENTLGRLVGLWRQTVIVRCNLDVARSTRAWENKAFGVILGLTLDESCSFLINFSTGNFWKSGAGPAMLRQTSNKANTSLHGWHNGWAGRFKLIECGSIPTRNRDVRNGTQLMDLS